MNHVNPDSYVRDTLLAGSRDASLLLQYLVRLQAEYRHVPATAIDELAHQLELPVSTIRGVVEFYSFLHLEPRGKYDIRFSNNITDQMLGSLPLQASLCNRLGVSIGKARADDGESG